MTPEEKVAMLKKAGVWDVIGFPSCIDKLFDLVAAHEREKLAEQEPVAWRVRGYNQFKTGNPAPWRYVDGADKPTVNKPDCCDFDPLYAAPVQKAKQEPVGWTAASNIVNDGYGHSFSVVSSEPANTTVEPYVPLYATPLAQQDTHATHVVRTKDPCHPWQDLTDDEIGSIYEKHHALGGCWTDGFAYERAVIAADRELNK